MSETTTAAAKKTAEKVVEAASNLSPNVVESTVAAVAIPAKVVVNQKLVVAVTAVTAATLGAVGYWGVQKFRLRNKTVVVTEVPADLNDKDTAEKA